MITGHKLGGLVDFVDVAAGSDTGRQRKRNEDAVHVGDGIVAVADGMGGLEGGDLASKTAISVIAERAAELRACAASGDGPRAIAAFEDVFEDASERVEALAEERGLHQMGSTLVCAVAGDESVFIAHVGDSRAYLARGGRLLQLTEDHNGARLLRARGLDETAIARDPRSDRLYQALGLGHVQPDVAEVRLGRADTLLLCSDGLYGPLPERALLEGARLPPDQGAQALIAAANRAGGPDNITVALVRAETLEDSDALAARTEQLRNIFLFEQLGDAELCQVAPFLYRRTYRSGEALAREGEDGDECLFIVEGTAVVHRGKLHLLEVGAGCHVGEMALTGSWKRTATVTARTDVVAFGFRRDAFDELLRSRPALGAQVARALARGLAGRLSDLTLRLDLVQKAAQGEWRG